MTWCLALTLLAGCTQVIDHGIGEVLSDCLAPIPPEVAGPGTPVGPVSLEYPSGSLWFWENAHAFVHSAEEGCSKIEFVPGAPVALLPDEVAENAARSDGRQVTVEAIGGFAAGGRGYLYYRKIVSLVGTFYFEYLGTGMCTLESPDAPCQRITPDLLWGPSDRAAGGPGFVDSDGYAYMMSCREDYVQSNLCMVARVLPDAAADPRAYSYADGRGGWSPNTADAAVELEALLATPSYLAARNAYISVFPVIADAAHPVLRAGQSDRPAGPYGAFATMFAAEPSDNLIIGGGREHAGLRRDDIVTLTYDARTSRTLVRAVHVVRFRFAP